MKKNDSSQVTILHSVNNKKFHQRQTDGYINATEFCKANGKRIGDFLELPSTQKYISFLTTRKSGSIETPIFTKEGKGGGTWIHPKIAIHLGQWISVEMMDLVSDLVLSWMQNTQQNNNFETQQPQQLSLFHELRAEIKPIRRNLTDTLKKCGKTGFQIIGFTRQINTAVFGKNPDIIRQERNLKSSDNLRDFMTLEELNLLKDLEEMAIDLLDAEFELKGVVSSGTIGKILRKIAEKKRIKKFKGEK